MRGVGFTVGAAQEAVAAAVPDRTAVVWRGRGLTHADLTDRSRRVARLLHGHGLGVQRERAFLGGHEVGQDLVALYLHNGPEYLEGLLGAFKSRVAPFNVNYRYVTDELRFLLQDAGPRAVIFHAAFAPALQEVRDALPADVLLLQVADDSGHPLLPGAQDYEEALSAVAPGPPPVVPSPDDLYVLYTGGTTGLPKGVLWRQHDIFFATMGGRQPGTWLPVASVEELASRAVEGPVTAAVLVPPLMHGAAQWAAFLLLHQGGTVVFPDVTTHLDPPSVLRAVENERASILTVVGDAFARPLLAEAETGRYDLRSLAVLGNGGAPLTPGVKERWMAALPHCVVNDAVGSSETGAQATHLSVPGAVSTGLFTPGPGTTVASADLSTFLPPGDPEVGWLVQTGWVPLGYLGDPERTLATFPSIEGIRCAVPGDRARLLADGRIELLGRDSVTINTGGEKVFAEEVEGVLASHPAVQDVTVCGRSSERWGSEVVAVVELCAPATTGELRAHAAQHLAGYKLPRAWVFVDRVQRSPSGKADYRWAREVAEGAT